jgi:serine protease Do
VGDFSYTLLHAGLKSTDGALVGDVKEGEPADKAGFERGDVIVDYNGEPIKDSKQLRDLVADAKPGSHVSVGVLRNGREKDLSVKLG